VKEFDQVGGLAGIHSGNFDEVAVAVYRFQFEHNALYRQFCNLLQHPPRQVKDLKEIPFLPISFFKTHAVTTTSFNPATIFESSGTTGSIPSRHLVKDLSTYETSFQLGFQNVYGAPSNWCILALLPTYLERQHSSLVHMTEHLIRKSGHPHSGFYLHDYARLAATLQELEECAQPTLLLGVSFALLDFAELYPMPLRHTTIIETGGMKGRKEEITREDLHERLCSAWKQTAIHSEYGMTELLSQAYSTGGGRFLSPPWMQVLAREEDDPLSMHGAYETVRTGAANIIDLANIYSCSFIATDDAVRLHTDDSFEILGRLDHSDVRGCSLMIGNRES